MDEGMIIRPAEDGDAEALNAIYVHHVRHGFGTFETEPTDAAWMRAKMADVGRYGLPFLVAERDGRLLGYAYAGAFRPRPGYRFTAEDSVYVAPDAARRGVGRALLSEVVRHCEAMGLRQLIAVIGDSQNAASIGLHRALGFVDAGVGKSLGYKLGRWLDVVWMQKPLNGGDATGPVGEGLPLADL